MFTPAISHAEVAVGSSHAVLRDRMVWSISDDTCSAGFWNSSSEQTDGLVVLHSRRAVVHNGGYDIRGKSQISDMTQLNVTLTYHVASYP